MFSERLLICLRVAAADAATFAAMLPGLLAQDGVDFRLVVVDDASAADCAAAVARQGDPRVRVLRNDTALGAARCRALALDASAAPFVAEIPERGDVLPGALSRLVDACAASPAVGLAHCYCCQEDSAGRVRRDAFRAHRRRLIARYGPDGDIRRELLVEGDVIGALRVFRREAFALLASPPSPRCDGGAEMIRIAARFEIAVVPGYLYRSRALPGTPRPSWLRKLVEAAHEAAACRRELRRERGRYARDNYEVDRLLAVRLYRAAGLRRIEALYARMKQWPERFVSGTLRPLVERTHIALVERFAPHAGRLLPRAARAKAGGAHRVAYYLWHFPVLSQTFVNRELAALTQAGVRVDIIADGAEDLALADHNAARLLGNTTYLDLADQSALARQRRMLRRQRPIAYYRVLLFVLACRHSRRKRFDSDLLLFAKAIRLVGVLREKGATHVHAPWADPCALVALMAARLLDIPYSVQARAHDLHRHSYQYGQRERIAPAAFVVTNTRYNESHLRALLGPDHTAKIHVIHNGIDLERFGPAARPPRGTGPVALLCVARLIEQKGLLHLLVACRELERRGVDFVCDVVGGTEEPLYTTYYLEVLRRRRQLGLEDRVRLLGARPLAEVLGLFRAADVFVLPCVVAADGSRDITPNSLIEAMAMGLPVVSTAVGGVPEIVEHGVSGLIVAPGDAMALADALEALIRDPQQCAALGAAARRRVEEKFDIAQNIRRYVELFASATSAPQATTAARTASTLARAPGD